MWEGRMGWTWFCQGSRGRTTPIDGRKLKPDRRFKQASVEIGYFARWRRLNNSRLGFVLRHHLVALSAGTLEEDLALSGVVRRANDAFLLHALHQGGGAVVADLQA